MSKKIRPLIFTSLGDDRNFALPESDFEEAESLCGVKFAEEQRNLIRQILLGNLSMSGSELASSDPKLVFTTLKKAKRLGLEFAKILEAIELNHEMEVIKHAFARHDFAAKDLVDLRLLISKLLQSVDESKARLEALEVGGKGPARTPGIDYFVWNIGFIFELAGGTASAAYAPEAVMPDGKTGGRNTPFVRLVDFFYSKQPKVLQKDFRSLGDAIYNSLKKRPEKYVPRGWEHRVLKIKGK